MCEVSEASLPALFPSTEDSSVTSPSAFTSEFFDFDDTVMPWSVLDTPSATVNPEGDTILAAPLGTNPFVDLGSLQTSVFSTPKTNSYITDESYSDSASITNLTNPTGLVLEQGTSSEDPSSETQCSCMSRALWMLQQLSSQSRGSSSRKNSTGMNTPGHQHRNSEAISPQSMVAQNKKNIQNILTMAGCSCLEDPYLLSIMCFLVFQVLSLYKAAVSGSASSSGSSDGSSLSPDRAKPQTGEDEAQMRKVAQSVLGELHLVQRLINVLSRRLKDYAAQGGEGATVHDYGQTGPALGKTPYNMYDGTRQPRGTALTGPQ
ncbi:hypothetical protein DL764_000350 [Monosporascus ibericus]|uniref:Aflatoxin regulatory protein domain-containing protein n=1 Tax=Monosporascus ibericus TaxID=155417 RepID=A0A4Q4TWD3_9PEZI|nr:hypothetical protein DL764_000350 [Monosporascus ibericus]